MIVIHTNNISMLTYIIVYKLQIIHNNFITLIFLLLNQELITQLMTLIFKLTNIICNNIINKQFDSP